MSFFTRLIPPGYLTLACIGVFLTVLMVLTDNQHLCKLCDTLRQSLTDCNYRVLICFKLKQWIKAGQFQVETGITTIVIRAYCSRKSCAEMPACRIFRQSVVRPMPSS